MFPRPFFCMLISALTLLCVSSAEAKPTAVWNHTKWNQCVFAKTTTATKHAGQKRQKKRTAKAPAVWNKTKWDKAVWQ